jgi:hypothetical protein
MDFIGRPQIYSWMGYEPSVFHYIPLGFQDRPGQVEDEACTDESQRI